MTEIEKLIAELMERAGDIHRDDNGGSDTALFVRAASALTKLTAPVTYDEACKVFAVYKNAIAVPPREGMQSALTSFLKGRSQ